MASILNAARISSRAAFSDPDGNVWLMQEITARLPGRVDAGADIRTAPRGDLARGAAARRPPLMASTKRRIGRGRSRTGPTGTPSTWSASRAGEALPQ